MATLANGGSMYRPHLIAYVDDPRTGEQRPVEPELVHKVPVRHDYLEFVKRAMAGVNKEGTAARSFANAPYTSGGKTGTAQLIGIKQNEKYEETNDAERLRDHSLVIAFAQALGNPRLLLVPHLPDADEGSEEHTAQLQSQSN